MSQTIPIHTHTQTHTHTHTHTNASHKTQQKFKNSFWESKRRWICLREWPTEWVSEWVNAWLSEWVRRREVLRLFSYFGEPLIFDWEVGEESYPSELNHCKERFLQQLLKTRNVFSLTRLCLRHSWKNFLFSLVAEKRSLSYYLVRAIVPSGFVNLFPDSGPSQEGIALTKSSNTSFFLNFPAERYDRQLVEDFFGVSAKLSRFCDFYLFSSIAIFRYITGQTTLLEERKRQVFQDHFFSDFVTKKLQSMRIRKNCRITQSQRF